MIITPHFVLILPPKTGTSSLSKGIIASYHSKLAQRTLIDRVKDKIKFMLRLEYPYCSELTRIGSIARHKHLNVQQIPKIAKSLPILSVFRDPFELIISNYTYGAWREKLHICGLSEKKEHNVDLFLEYLKRMKTVYGYQCGFFSGEFCKQHGVDGKNKEEVFFELGKRFLWLRTECLNDDFRSIQNQLGIPVDYYIDVPHINKSKKNINEEERIILENYCRVEESILLTFQFVLATKFQGSRFPLQDSLEREVFSE